MEDSGMFMLWALSTLQHEHPPATPAPAYDDGGHTFLSLPELGYSASLNSMVPGEPPAREGHRATSSWSSGDTDSGSASATAMERDGCSPSQNSVKYASPPSSGTNQPVSWNFNSASVWPSKEAMLDSVAAARTKDGGGGGVRQMVQGSLPTRTIAKSPGSSSSAPYAQDHIIAERKRREKINQRFIELSTVIPGLKKMDKATILSDATRYVKELQEKLKAHEDGCGTGRRSSIESAVLVKRSCIAAPDDEDGCPPSHSASGPVVGRTVLPEIEAWISDSNVTVRIRYEHAKGVLARLFDEVEGLHLSIVHANVIPFPASTMIMNIVAKVEEGFSTTADGLVSRLSCALHQHSRNNTEETKSCC